MLNQNTRAIRKAIRNAKQKPYQNDELILEKPKVSKASKSDFYTKVLARRSFIEQNLVRKSTSCKSIQHTVLKANYSICEPPV